MPREEYLARQKEAKAELEAATAKLQEMEEKYDNFRSVGRKLLKALELDDEYTMRDILIAMDAKCHRLLYTEFRSNMASMLIEGDDLIQKVGLAYYNAVRSDDVVEDDLNIITEEDDEIIRQGYMVDYLTYQMDKDAAGRWESDFWELGRDAENSAIIVANSPAWHIIEREKIVPEHSSSVHILPNKLIELMIREDSTLLREEGCLYDLLQAIESIHNPNLLLSEYEFLCALFNRIDAGENLIIGVKLL